MAADVPSLFLLFLPPSAGQSETALYPPTLVRMCNENKSSLEISFLHLSDAEPILAVWVADEPNLILEIFDEEATNVTFTLYPEYANIQQDVHVRMTELPIVDKIRDLRQHHLDCLIRVEGVVTRRTGVFPQMQVVTYNCQKCKALTGSYVQNGNQETKPGRCPEVSLFLGQTMSSPSASQKSDADLASLCRFSSPSPQCQSPGPFNVNSQETIYRNYQRITLQEAPGSVPAGRVPRQKDVILLHDLIDSCSPGEMVDITGIYKHTFDPSLNTKNGFPVFQTVLQANYVSKQAEAMASFRLSDDDLLEVSGTDTHVQA
jgi:DNA replication licensing factor MCM2